MGYDSGDSGDAGDGWDSFDWNSWGVTPEEQADETEAGAESGNGHASGNGFARPGHEDAGEGERAGQWVARGGVLRWDDGADTDALEDKPLTEEAKSAWAEEDIDLPLGAPPTARVRATRAWLARRRQRETELIGELLLERRRLYPPDEDGTGTARGLDEGNPLQVALAEAQAAADEYETLLGLLEDVRAHGGAQAALVEFYLTVTERLATLASDPAAPEEFVGRALVAAPVEEEAHAAQGEQREPTPRERAEWGGRAGAALATRLRVERVAATEPEDD